MSPGHFTLATLPTLHLMTVSGFHDVVVGLCMCPADPTGMAFYCGQVTSNLAESCAGTILCFLSMYNGR